MEFKESMNYIEFTNEQFDEIVAAMDESNCETIQEFILNAVRNA